MIRRDPLSRTSQHYCNIRLHTDTVSSGISKIIWTFAAALRFDLGYLLPALDYWVEMKHYFISTRTIVSYHCFCIKLLFGFPLWYVVRIVSPSLDRPWFGWGLNKFQMLYQSVAERLWSVCTGTPVMGIRKLEVTSSKSIKASRPNTSVVSYCMTHKVWSDPDLTWLKCTWNEIFIIKFFINQSGDRQQPSYDPVHGQGETFFAVVTGSIFVPFTLCVAGLAVVGDVVFFALYTLE